MKPMMQRVWRLLPAMLLTLPALAPLMRGGFFVSDDGLFHVYRAAALANAWQQGVLHPRLFPEFGFGYGQAVLNFYAPLAYWPPALLALVGLAPAGAVEVAFALGFVLAALAAYGFARRLFGHWGGLLAAVAYTYFPYHLADVYVRGALPEHFAFIWPPLILWALTAVFRDEHPRAPLLWGGLAWAGLILTHNLTALLMLPVAFIYGALLAVWTGRTRRIVHAVALLVFGLGLSAPLWLPYFAESQAVGLALGPSDGYKAHLAPLSRLVQSSLFYQYRDQAPVVSPDTLRADFPLSWLTVLLVLVVLALSLWRGRRTHARPAIGFGLLLVILSVLMTSAASLPIWEPLTPILGNLQYPWRLLVLAAVGLIPVAGALPGLVVESAASAEHPERSCHGLRATVQDESDADPLSAGTLSGVPAGFWAGTQSKGPERVNHAASFDCAAKKRLLRSGCFQSHFQGSGGLNLYAGLLFFAALLIVQPLPHIPLEPLPITAADTWTPDRMWREDAAAGQVGATWTGEFLPLTVTEQRWALGRPREGASETPAPASRPIVTVEQAGYDSLAFVVETAEPATVRLHQFHLPMWRAQLNGADAPTYPTGELGLVSVDVPAGRQSVALRFGPSRSWVIGGALAALAALAWAVLAWGAGRALRTAAGVLLALALVLGLNGLGVGQRRWTPQPAQTAVGDVALLVAYDVTPVRGVDALDVTLYWYALRETATNYKVFVHVLGPDGGQVIGQHDGDPVGGFTPTTRWRSGEVIVDRHRIPLPAGLAGGVGVRAGMYRPEPVQNLPLDPATADGRVGLGTTTIR